MQAPSVTAQAAPRPAAQGADCSRAYRRRFVGQNVRVLVERPKAPDGWLAGHADHYFKVRFANTSGLEADRLVGRLVTVCVEGLTAGGVAGRLICVDD